MAGRGIYRLGAGRKSRVSCVTSKADSPPTTPLIPRVSDTLLVHQPHSEEQINVRALLSLITASELAAKTPEHRALLCCEIMLICLTETQSTGSEMTHQRVSRIMLVQKKPLCLQNLCFVESSHRGSSLKPVLTMKRCTCSSAEPNKASEHI